MDKKYVRFSSLLEHVPPTKQLVFFRSFRSAVEGGTLQAVPLTEQLELTTEGRTQRREEHIIKATPELDAWLKATVEAFNNKGRTPYALTPSTLESGNFEFDKLAAIHRAALLRQAKNRKSPDKNIRKTALKGSAKSSEKNTAQNDVPDKAFTPQPVTKSTPPGALNPSESTPHHPLSDLLKGTLESALSHPLNLSPDASSESAFEHAKSP